MYPEPIPNLKRFIPHCLPLGKQCGMLRMSVSPISTHVAYPIPQRCYHVQASISRYYAIGCGARAIGIHFDVGRHLAHLGVVPASHAVWCSLPVPNLVSDCVPEAAAARAFADRRGCLLAVPHGRTRRGRGVL